MFNPDDIRLTIETLRRNPLLKKGEELALAKRIFTTRIEVWERALSYEALSEALLDFAQPELLKLAAPMKKELELDKLEACRKAACDLRQRGLRGRQRDFARACKEAAEAICEIDASLRVLSVVRNVAHQRKPFGRPTPRKTSGRFPSYLAALDAKIEAHRVLKERFWAANIRLAVKLAAKYDHGLVPFPDLMQEGLLGLMIAVERFDHRKGFKFVTYAPWWVRHALSRFTANHGRTVRWTVRTVQDFDRLRKAHDKLRAAGESSDINSLAKISKLTAKRVELILSLNTLQPISLDTKIPGFDDTLVDRLTAENLEIDDGPSHLDPQLKKIRDKIDRLPGIEGRIIIERFGLDGKGERTLREIGDEHSLSRERIRQLQERGLDRLRRSVTA